MNATYAIREHLPLRTRPASPVRRIGPVRLPGAGRREEDRLVDGLRRREQWAIEAVYARHAPGVLGFLVRALRDRNAAEDVLQEVFVDAWRRADSFDPSRSSMSTWLLVIARSRAVDHLRRRVPEPRDTSDPATPEAEDPEDALGGLLSQWRFADLMSRLSDDEARVLRMRFHLGLSQSEISAETGMPLGTVKTKMNRALARLRDLMDEEEGER